MLTLLLYVLIVGLVAALLFLVASAVFGRGEELGPLPEGTTATVLPAAGIRGADVRALRFQQVFRGYKAGEVDWALSRLAARIDELEAQLAQRNPAAESEDSPPFGPAPQQPGTSGIGPDTDPHGPATNATSIGWPGTTSGFPPPLGSVPPGFGGWPGGPDMAPPPPGAGPVRPFGTGFGGESLGSASPVDPTGAGYRSHPFASGHGAGPAPNGWPPPTVGDSAAGSYTSPIGPGTIAPGIGTFPAAGAPAAGYPAPESTAPGIASQTAPGATPTASESTAIPEPQIAPEPDAPANSSTPESGYGPAATAPGGPATNGPAAPVDTAATGSWAPPPLPSDPQPRPGGLR